MGSPVTDSRSASFSDLFTVVPGCSRKNRVPTKRLFRHVNNFRRDVESRPLENGNLRNGRALGLVKSSVPCRCYTGKFRFSWVPRTCEQVVTNPALNVYFFRGKSFLRRQPPKNRQTLFPRLGKSTFLLAIHNILCRLTVGFRKIWYETRYKQKAPSLPRITIS
jgi:hypothetical protein